MCAVVSESRSAVTRAGRRSDIGRHRKKFHQTSQRQLVTISAETADDGESRISERGAAALRLAGVDVGQMDFNERNLHSGQSVADGEAGMAVSARVHERAIHATPQSVHRLDDFPFPIVLRERELDSE